MIVGFSGIYSKHEISVQIKLLQDIPIDMEKFVFCLSWLQVGFTEMKIASLAPWVNLSNESNLEP